MPGHSFLKRNENVAYDMRSIHGGVDFSELFINLLIPSFELQAMTPDNICRAVSEWQPGKDWQLLDLNFSIFELVIRKEHCEENYNSVSACISETKLMFPNLGKIG